jgi:DNA-binding NtrC family response regulator
MAILLEDLNLRKAERLLCLQALEKGGSIVEAAQLLGITRHALKRRMIKHRIDVPADDEREGRAADAAPITAHDAS